MTILKSKKNKNKKYFITKEKKPMLNVRVKKALLTILTACLTVLMTIGAVLGFTPTTQTVKADEQQFEKVVIFCLRHSNVVISLFLLYTAPCFRQDFITIVSRKISHPVSGAFLPYRR